MNSICGIIFGIGCDNVIKIEENTAIYNWMDEYIEYESEPEFYKCYSILHQVLADNFISNEEYHLLMECFFKYIKSNTYSDSTLSMQILKGIIEGIAIDNEVYSEEANKLYQWMADNVALKGNYPFDKIFATLENFLENGVIDKEEEKDFLAIFNQFSNPQQVQNPELDLTSKEWKYGNYGAKVSKAVQMQEKGIVIQIISEEALYKA